MPALNGPARTAPNTNGHHAATSTRLLITIDGPAGVGKSTAAKLLARKLGILYIDTGATYRSLAYVALASQVSLANVPQLVKVAKSLPLVLRRSRSGGLRVLLDGRDVTRVIRTERITDAAAVVDQHAKVRAILVRLQRRLAGQQSCVVEGRDTGSVVFPGASHKFFLTARTTIRAKRRHAELCGIQLDHPSISTIARQLRQRDRLDRSRQVGPLIRPAGAIRIDTSDLDAQAVVSRMLDHLSPKRRTHRHSRPSCQSDL